jgi:uncharacterized membrane protein
MHNLPSRNKMSHLKKVASIIPVICLLAIPIANSVLLYSASTVRKETQKMFFEGWGFVSGHVVDEKTGEPLTNVVLSSSTGKVGTGTEGAFVISGKAGPDTLIVERNGYLNSSIKVWFIPQDGKFLLEQSGIETSEIIKLSLDKANKEIGVSFRTIQEIELFAESAYNLQVIFLLFALVAIPALYLYLKQTGYRSVLVLTLISACSNGLGGLGSGLAVLALIFIIVSKERFAEIEFARNFGLLDERKNLRATMHVSLIVLACLMWLWVSLLLLAPFVVPKGSIGELGNLVGVIEHSETWQKLGVPWQGIYTYGDLVCHQIPDRSLSLKENQFPLCSRCLGMRIGLAFGFTFCLLKKPNLSLKQAFLLSLVCLLPFGIDAGFQYLNLWESINISRFTTGTLFGFFVASVFVVTFLNIGNPYEDV